jgi:tRNA(Ile)-lysidine synthase
LRGLVGVHDIRPVQPGSHVQLVRPFLSQRRATIEEMCAARDLPIRHDSMNKSNEFTRGRIRHKVLPLLRDELNPQVTEALLRLSEHARWLGTYLEDAAARALDSLVISEGSSHLTLNARGLQAKQRIIQAEIVRLAVSVVLNREQELSFTNVESILRLAEGTVSGKEVHVPGPVVVRKQYDRLEFRPLEDEDPPPDIGSVFVACPGSTVLGTLGLELQVEVCEVDAERLAQLQKNTDRHEEWVDYEQVELPLLVRGRHEGDRFRPLGGPGAKTIGDFLSDEKIDPKIRVRTGILCDQRGPLWVMPLRIDERAKLTPKSRKALRLVLTPLAAPTG